MSPRLKLFFAIGGFIGVLITGLGVFLDHGPFHRKPEIVIDSLTINQAAAIPAGTSTTVTETKIETATAPPPPPKTDYLRSGRNKAALGDYLGARVEFDRAVAANPKNPDAWANLGAAEAMLGNADRAQYAYERALAASNNHNWLAHYNLACLFARGGRRSEALQHVGMAVAQYKDKTTSRADLETLFAKIRSDDALTSIRNDPDFTAMLELD